MANQNILANINQFVKEELDKENIPSDAKMVVVGTVNNDGARIMAAVTINQTEKTTTRVAAIWDHNWTGDDTVGAKVIFVSK